MIGDSTFSIRFVASLKASLMYALPGMLLVACGGGVSPMISGSGAGMSVVRSTAGAVARAETKSQKFHYTGKKQTFTVPPGVTRIRVKAMGAGTASARGGLAAATI
ncbi:MAG: hypothetical protein ABSD52_14725, partial [Candidatus Cybelea sp.]